MVSVSNSKGRMVEISVVGIEATKRELEKSRKMILKHIDIGLLRATDYAKSEVQESIIGNRAELKSVDTGLFASNIKSKKTDELTSVVYPSSITYPGTTTTVAKVAKWMEYGTKYITGRRHFRNTAARIKPKIVQIMKENIKGKSFTDLNSVTKEFLSKNFPNVKF